MHISNFSFFDDASALAGDLSWDANGLVDAGMRGAARAGQALQDASQGTIFEGTGGDANGLIGLGQRAASGLGRGIENAADSIFYGGVNAGRTGANVANQVFDAGVNTGRVGKQAYDAVDSAANQIYDAGEASGRFWRNNGRSITDRVVNAPATIRDAVGGVGENIQDVFGNKPGGGGAIPQSLKNPYMGFDEFSPLKYEKNEWTPSILEGDGKLPLNRDPKGFGDPIIERADGGFTRVSNDGAGSLLEYLPIGRVRLPKPEVPEEVAGGFNRTLAGLGAGAAGLGAGIAGLTRRAGNTAEVVPAAATGLTNGQKLAIGGGVGAGLGAAGLAGYRTMQDE
jgi:hypothetical protein